VSAPSHRVVTRCRICSDTSFAAVLSLGETPLANAFLAPGRSEPEARFPLELIRCQTCGLVQLSIVVAPEILFRHYLYSSGASAPMVAHFDSYAAELVERFAPAGSLVVEIGSNDGVLLRPLAARGARVVGIEPAKNLAATASDAGLETWNEFFGSDAARRLAKAYGPARAVVANNVLAHIDDLRDVVAGVDELIGADGILVAEVPYLGDLLDHVEYDTIYHEHLSYFALGPFRWLLEAAGLELFDVRRVAVHGGSVRLFGGRAGRRPRTPALITALEDEERRGLRSPSTYARFATRVAASREALREVLRGAVSGGARVAALGATAKGNTLLNYCGIGNDVVSFVADSTPLKQGLLTPGTRIPVRPESAIYEERPDYILLLAWNYAAAVLAKFADYTAAGGRFIHPIPIARIIA
jgi:SAM-dependent methyltransferase